MICHLLEHLKEVKQFLGLVGYYCKFIPRFLDIARPLNALTRNDHEFMWDTICEQLFQLLKQMRTQEPILLYSNPSKPYVLFTNASKYAWSCLLTQEYVYEFDGKEKKILHPITYMNGLFKGSQTNWACLTKEAYAIYMWHTGCISFFFNKTHPVMHHDWVTCNTDMGS